MSGDAGQYVVSEAERNAVLDSLVRACGEGLMTLEEFSRRTDVALSSASRADLVAVTADLATSLVPVSKVKRRWFVPFGTRVKRGRFVLPERTTAVVLMGEIYLDLRGATLVGPEPTIKLWVLVGNLHVLAPRGVGVEVDMSSMLGGRSISGYGPAPGAAAPLVRIRMIDMMGTVKVSDDPAAWNPSLAPGAPRPPGQTPAVGRGEAIGGGGGT